MPSPRVAIVGSGPAGFYTADALLRDDSNCRVDMFERLFAPFGLVRYGVAPDHQKLKQVARVFDGIADHERFSFYGSIEVGRDITLAQLRQHYHAVVVATGQARDRKLGIPGESLDQVFGSTAFVRWYNGHPDYARLTPDLGVETAAVVGNGNVALDACRLLIRDYGDLRVSDIPEPMQPAFAARRLRTIHILGRSSVTATKFTFKEFRQLIDLPGVRLAVPQAPNWSAAAWASPASKDAARVADWLHDNAADSASAAADDEITVNFWFHATPQAFLGSRTLQGVALQPATASAMGSVPERLDAALTVTCIGYAPDILDGLPADDGGCVRHDGGQVLDAQGREVPGLFVSGWVKRGPTGIIGTNRADGHETAGSVLTRLPRLINGDDGPSTGPEDMDLDASMSYATWRFIDQYEKQQGERFGKPREKLLDAHEALEALQKLRSDSV